MDQSINSQITDTVRSHVVAMSVADGEGLRAAFHPSAPIVGDYQGTVGWLSNDASVGEVVGAGLPPNHNPPSRLGSLDVTADAAVAKLEDPFGTMTFTDDLSLLHIDGECKIVGKLHHLHA